MMLHAQLLRDMRSHRRSAIALARVVPAGQEGDAAFARIVGLRLRNLARDEGIGAGGDRRLEIALGTAGAPGDPADLALPLPSTRATRRPRPSRHARPAPGRFR